MHSTFPRCIVPEPPFTYTFMIDRGLYTQKIEQIQNKPVLVYIKFTCKLISKTQKLKFFHNNIYFLKKLKTSWHIQAHVYMYVTIYSKRTIQHTVRRALMCIYTTIDYHFVSFNDLDPHRYSLRRCDVRSGPKCQNPIHHHT